MVKDFREVAWESWYDDEANGWRDRADDQTKSWKDFVAGWEAAVVYYAEHPEDLADSIRFAAGLPVRGDAARGEGVNDG